MEISSGSLILDFIDTRHAPVEVVVNPETAPFMGIHGTGKPS